MDETQAHNGEELLRKRVGFSAGHLAGLPPPSASHFLLPHRLFPREQTQAQLTCEPAEEIEQQQQVHFLLTRVLLGGVCQREPTAVCFIFQPFCVHLFSLLYFLFQALPTGE